MTTRSRCKKCGVYPSLEVNLYYCAHCGSLTPYGRRYVVKSLVTGAGILLIAGSMIAFMIQEVVRRGLE